MKNQTNTSASPSNDNPMVKTRINCRVPSANSIFVAGSFNDWNPNQFPLAWAPEEIPVYTEDPGLWAVELELPPGTHQFKFVVDGERCCLESCEGTHISHERSSRDDGEEVHVLEIPM